MALGEGRHFRLALHNGNKTRLCARNREHGDGKFEKCLTQVSQFRNLCLSSKKRSRLRIIEDDLNPTHIILGQDEGVMGLG